MSDAILYNSIAARCTIAPCLWQVAGHVNNDPAAQLAACQSAFGFPVVPTVTIPAEDVVVVITTSTALATDQQTSTAWHTVDSTVTEYTTTVTNTVLTTVTAAAPSVTAVPRKRGVKRGGCKPKTTTSTETQTPTADFCADPSVYSSACACVAPPTVTEYASAATSIIDEIATFTSFATQEADVTQTATEQATVQGTTTLLSTLSTATTVTTTVTSTASPAPAAPTGFGLILADGPYAGKSLVTSGTAPAYAYIWVATGNPRRLALPSAGAQPFVENNTAYKMYVRMSTAAYGIVLFTTPQYITSSGYVWFAASCAISGETLVMSCSAGSLTRFVQCGSNIYMANDAIRPGGGVEVHLKAPSA